MRPQALLLLLLPLLAACAGGTVEEAGTRQYSCNDGTRFSVTGGEKEVTLTFPDEAFVLPRVQSGSGRKYTDRRLLFWDQGENKAVVATSEHGMVRCREEP